MRITLAIFFLICCCSGVNAQKGFRAAVVKIDISPSTPKQLLGYSARLSTGIHDRIYHRIIALDDGTTQFFLVATEVCEFSPSEYDHVAALLNKRFGIKPVNFWWSVSHTHSAPEVGVPGLAEAFMGERYKHEVDTAYTSFIEQSLINGIDEARKKLQPAKLGVGWGFSQANINRRAVDVDGKASLGLNPDGPVDRRIGLIRLVKQDGSPLALMVNYPIHGTVLGQENVEISGDVTGIVSEYVEQKTGAPVIFINGAAGNLAPIYSVYPNPQSGHLNQFRVLLGDKIIDANKNLTSLTDSVKITTSSITVESPRKQGLGWPAYLANYSRTTKDGANLVKTPVRFLKINEDIGIWSTPLELFCEISNEVRDRSPYPFTFYYGYTNGWLGYLPTEDEWKYGGYEVNMVSPFTPVMGRTLTEAVVAYLEGEMQGKKK
ncbi:MAG TPA: neutral/alkaline non-lysosomal ceramidase N-terminal domain-containing protein [Flavitalea sp.]|nr:neutral/alkaline non-lysosomal ceramidase N-terminal domain-containing protein [Flavitalea sp.]